MELEVEAQSEALVARRRAQELDNAELEAATAGDFELAAEMQAEELAKLEPEFDSWPEHGGTDTATEAGSEFVHATPVTSGPVIGERRASEQLGPHAPRGPVASSSAAAPASAAPGPVAPVAAPAPREAQP